MKLGEIITTPWKTKNSKNLKMYLLYLPESNIAPETLGLENEFPF